MASAMMTLKILLPFQVFTEKTEVSRVVVETLEGSVGLLPHRLDCVTALGPGILAFETESEGEVFVAIDEGILVKTGFSVVISVRNAIGGTDLNELHAAVEREFRQLSEVRQQVRSAMVRMESGFIRRVAELHRE